MLNNQLFYILTFFGSFLVAGLFRFFLFNNKKYKYEQKLALLEVLYDTLFFFTIVCIYAPVIIMGVFIMDDAYLPENNAYKIIWALCIVWQMLKILLICISIRKCKHSYNKKRNYSTKYNIDKVKILEINDSYSNEDKYFQAYILSEYKEYDGEKWDKTKYKILFSHEEILNELISCKNVSMIDKCNECLDDQPRKLILKYLNINENEKSDISFDKLYHSTCLINDSYVIDIITGCNKNLINNYKQFLCL